MNVTTGGGAVKGDDAQDHAPKPEGDAGKGKNGDKRDAANTQRREDESDAVEVENLNSENDEGSG